MFFYCLRVRCFLRFFCFFVENEVLGIFEWERLVSVGRSIAESEPTYEEMDDDLFIYRNLVFELFFFISRLR